MQELVELAEQIPFVVHVSREGARMELVESQPTPAPARVPDPVEAPTPKKRRKGRKPGPKPKRQARAIKGPLSIPCKTHKVAAGTTCSKTGAACRDRRRIFRESNAKTASSTPAAIPRRMKTGASAPAVRVTSKPKMPGREGTLSPSEPASPSPRKISKATATTHAIAERIEGADGRDPEIARLTVCPHCNEALAAGRYGGLRCRQAGCDLFQEDLFSTRSYRDDCNCAVCIHARAIEAQDLETAGGVAAESQTA